MRLSARINQYSQRRLPREKPCQTKATTPHSKAIRTPPPTCPRNGPHRDTRSREEPGSNASSRNNREAPGNSNASIHLSLAPGSNRSNPVRGNSPRCPVAPNSVHPKEGLPRNQRSVAWR